MERDAVAPECPSGPKQGRPDRALELLGGSPARLRDLATVERIELLCLGAGREDERAPVDRLFPVPKARFGGDEEPLELDLDAELLQGLAADTVLERLVRPGPSARWAPEPRGVVRLADQREPLAVEDEEGDVVTALG